MSSFSSSSELPALHHFPQASARRPEAGEAGDFSAKQFRRELFDKFSRTGLGQQLKAQLRSSVLSEIRGRQPSSAPSPILQRILNALIADYFQHQDYLYSLSIFLPESGTGDGFYGGFRPQDVLETLRIGGENNQNTWLWEFLKQAGMNMEQLGEKENNGPPQANGKKTTSLAPSWHRGSLLSLLVEGLVHFPIRTVAIEQGCQTDAQQGLPPGASVDLKLKVLDDQFLTAQLLERELPFRTLEERLVKYQREINEKANAEIAHEVERIRSREISTMRLDERARFLGELDNERAKLERVYSERLQTLKSREEKLLADIKLKESAMESSRFENRQRLLEELDKIRSKEVEIRRSEDLTAKEILFEKEKWTDKNRQLEEEIKALQKERQAFADSLAQQTGQIERSYTLKLQKKEFEVEDLNIQLKASREGAQQSAEAVESHKQQIDSLRGELLSIKAQRESYRDTIHSLETRVAVLEEQKRFLENSNSQFAARQVEMNSLQPEMHAALTQVADLRAELHGQTAQFEQTIRQLQAAATEAIKSEQENAQRWAAEEAAKAGKIIQRLRGDRQQALDELESAKAELLAATAALEENQLRAKQMQRDMEQWKKRTAERPVEVQQARTRPTAGVLNQPPVRVLRSQHSGSLLASRPPASLAPTNFALALSAGAPLGSSLSFTSPVDSALTESSVILQGALDEQQRQAVRRRQMLNREEKLPRHRTTEAAMKMQKRERPVENQAWTAENHAASEVTSDSDFPQPAVEKQEVEDFATRDALMLAAQAVRDRDEIVRKQAELENARALEEKQQELEREFQRKRAKAVAEEEARISAAAEEEAKESQPVEPVNAHVEAAPIEEPIVEAAVEPLEVVDLDVPVAAENPKVPEAAVVEEIPSIEHATVPSVENPVVPEEIPTEPEVQPEHVELVAVVESPKIPEPKSPIIEAVEYSPIQPEAPAALDASISYEADFDGPSEADLSVDFELAAREREEEARIQAALEQKIREDEEERKREERRQEREKKRKAEEEERKREESLAAEAAAALEADRQAEAKAAEGREKMKKFLDMARAEIEAKQKAEQEKLQAQAEEPVEEIEEDLGPNSGVHSPVPVAVIASSNSSPELSIELEEREFPSDNEDVPF